jgi:hypothetical protein
MDIRFATWNVRSLYRVGSLVAVSKELSRYMLDLVGGGSGQMGGQWGPNQRENAHFSMEMGMRVMNLVQVFFFCIIKSYQQLRGLSLLVIGCLT